MPWYLPLPKMATGEAGRSRAGKGQEGTARAEARQGNRCDDMDRAPEPSGALGQPPSGLRPGGRKRATPHLILWGAVVSPIPHNF